jgi:transposase
VFAGLDVDKRSISVTFTNHQGFIRSMRMPYSVEHLVNHVRKHFPDQKVAFVYEAGPTGYGLYDGLVANSYPCLIASPSMIPKAPGQRVKTNRLDSVGLAGNLRGGQLKSIHVPTGCTASFDTTHCATSLSREGDEAVIPCCSLKG